MRDQNDAYVWWESPALSRSDFSFADLVAGVVSVFVVLPLDRLRLPGRLLTVTRRAKQSGGRRNRCLIIAYPFRSVDEYP